MANRLETMVRRVGRELDFAQRAKLWKLPNDLRITGSGEAVFGEKGPADFFGHTASGRAIFLECKDIKSPTLALGSRGIKPHQWIALAELHKCGGIGLVIWAREDQVAVLDVDMIKSLTRGRKSISWRAIPGEWKHPFTLPGILALLEQQDV
jgi:penicillin-binding protein-related factor A (putative recombinase)